MRDTLELIDLPALPAAKIGVFDSGVGGLSILHALHDRLPDASMVYVGDVAFAPYGDRPADSVVQRSGDVVAWLIAQGATIIVVACNTATVLAIEALRARWPKTLFVGVEPGIKPAAARSRRIGVMVTAGTAGSARFRHLIDRYAGDALVHVQACPGLADAIERGTLEGPALRELLMPHSEALRAADVDTVVLGCTHYPFVETTIRELLGPGIALIDTAGAIAERSAALWEQAAPPFDPAPGVRVFSTGATDTMSRLLSRSAGLCGTPVEVLTIIPSQAPG